MVNERTFSQHNNYLKINYRTPKTQFCVVWFYVLALRKYLWKLILQPLYCHGMRKGNLCVSAFYIINKQTLMMVALFEAILKLNILIEF